MKRIIIILCVTTLATSIGLYFRPSYVLIGQLNWINVLTKGYFVGSIAKFFSQSLLDQSFYFVMSFTAGGMLLGIILAIFFGGSGKRK